MAMPRLSVPYTNTSCGSESPLLLNPAMTIALLVALAGSLLLMGVIVRRLERS